MCVYRRYPRQPVGKGYHSDGHDINREVIPDGGDRLGGVPAHREVDGLESSCQGSR